MRHPLMHVALSAATLSAKNRIGRRSLVSLAAALAMFMISCTSDQTSSASVAGTWSAAIGNVTGMFEGDSATCHGTAPTTLTLTQAGKTVGGTFNGGELDCTQPSGTLAISLDTGTVANGTVNGNAIAFDLSSAPGTVPIHISGTVAGNVMSGAISFHDAAHNSALDGVWSAEKQP